MRKAPIFFVHKTKIIFTKNKAPNTGQAFPVYQRGGKFLMIRGVLLAKIQLAYKDYLPTVRITKEEYLMYKDSEEPIKFMTYYSKPIEVVKRLPEVKK